MAKAKIKHVSRSIRALERSAQQTEKQRQAAEVVQAQMQGQLYQTKSNASAILEPLNSKLASAIEAEELENDVGSRKSQQQAEKLTHARTLEAGKQKAIQVMLIRQAESRLSEAKARVAAAKQAEAEANAVAFGASLQMTTLSSRVDALGLDNADANRQLKHLHKYAKLLQSQACRNSKDLSKASLSACEHSVRKLVQMKQEERQENLKSRKTWLVTAKNSQQKLKDELLRLDVLANVSHNLKQKVWNNLLKKKAKDAKVGHSHSNKTHVFDLL